MSSFNAFIIFSVNYFQLSVLLEAAMGKKVLLMVKPPVVYSNLQLKAMMCLWLSVFLLITDPTEVYTWGNNTNFSLGHGNQESRQHPELVDVFARTGVYIKQVGQ